MARIKSTNEFDSLTAEDFLAMGTKYTKHTEAIQASLDKHPVLSRADKRDSKPSQALYLLPILRPLEPGNNVIINARGHKMPCLAYMLGIVQDPPCYQCAESFERMEVSEVTAKGKGPPFAKCVVPVNHLGGACLGCEDRKVYHRPCSFLGESQSLTQNERFAILNSQSLIPDRRFRRNLEFSIDHFR